VADRQRSDLVVLATDGALDCWNICFPSGHICFLKLLDVMAGEIFFLDCWIVSLIMGIGLD
jgi:hypothetical protein